MTPGLHNRICAHPTAISWFIGACALNGLMLILPLVDGVRLIDMEFDGRGAAWLLVMILAAVGGGFFFGLVVCWGWIRPLCGRINGAPLKVGDRVLVLSRRCRGITARVYEITWGQGGWELLRLDLGPERRAGFEDIFEPHSVLKIAGSSADGTNGIQSAQDCG